MTYPTLMVQLEAGSSNTRILRIAGHLAEQFHADVVGIAACQPMQIVYGSGCYVAAGIIEQDRDDIEKQIKTAEAEFRNALGACAGNIMWRSSITFSPLANYVAHEARSADLILTGGNSGALPNASQQVNKGDLIMQAGRPVLIVPAVVDELVLDRVVIGWKDTREARRATHDALPLLKRVGQVTVVELADEECLAASRTHLADVVHWLKRHGVRARSLALPSAGDDVVQLRVVAREQNADMVVAGAYGHSRLREWALGGVTRDLLLHADRCSFVSH